MPAKPEEEAFWKKIRSQFLLGPGEVYLNTGSFGAVPRPVFDCATEAMRRRELNPTRQVEAGNLGVSEARKKLSSFLNVIPEDLAFTFNVTMSINMIVYGLTWEAGDEILASDQEYGAIDNCLHHATQKYGVVVTRAQVPIPLTDAKTILEAFAKAITPRTRLMLVSHVATRTGLITPLRRLAELAHERGVLIAVDGAHAPGMIPLDLTDLGCDFYGGNCHKWLCAPKGTGFLHARPEVQSMLRHVVVSWGYSQQGMEPGDDGRPQINGRSAMHGLEMWGTRDLAHFEAVGAAVDFQEGIGRERIAGRGRQLAGYLRERMREVDGVRLLTPTIPEMSGSLSAFELSGFDGVNVGKELYERCRITVPCNPTWMRVSTHYYNGFEEVDALVEGLKALRGQR
ncbi:MAG: aminotransferase class V-fold PLP-dependent enzyme [Candidatus Latescibacteria bacterium]|nr:aminotransferase class V-fold PLP-dependent enzyme [Candidatus Latescibacterota bacterium]